MYKYLIVYVNSYMQQFNQITETGNMQYEQKTPIRSTDLPKIYEALAKKTAKGCVILNIIALGKE